MLVISFHSFLVFKPNKAKCEIAGIGVLKGVSLALCGMDCIDLIKTKQKNENCRNKFFL